MYAQQNVESGPRTRGTTKAVRQTPTFLFMPRGSDKLSELLCAALDTFHLFGAHLWKISSGKWRAWIFVCLGQDGTA